MRIHGPVSEEWDLPEELQRYIDANKQVNLAERQATLRFAAILCSCRPWYDRHEPDTHEYCAVHTTVLFTEDGQMLLSTVLLP